MWTYTGQHRPDFADKPDAQQESVWDYPRPPALVSCAQRVEVRSGSEIIASSTATLRVLETASPPTVYIPPEDIRFEHLQRVAGSSYCEWKGAAEYWALAADTSISIGWSYPDPTPAFSSIGGWLCFYPGRVECYIDDERVRPQDGGFYGGWVTDNIVGPWKGGPNTGHW
ncbi:MAG: DUF427 domain-containing protein [Gammaproteobacteria bacterium]|nr:DUF427 domain-containing protein [Gammaproteobacteria bacterium]